MEKIITFHSYKSTGQGGIESFVRFLQMALFSRTTAVECIEVFSLAPAQELFSENPQVEYVHLPSASSRFRSIGALSRKVSFWRFLRRSLLCPHGVKPTLLLMQVHDLLFVPSAVLKNSTIILVQTNRADVWLGTLAGRIARIRLRHVDWIVAYTDLDVLALNEYLPPNRSPAIAVIPRACRLPKAAGPRFPSPRLVTIARIDEEQKNFREMIDIVSDLDETFTLDIYGDGNADQLSDLELAIDGHRQVRYMGPAKDVVTVLSKYSIFLMTSRYEGFGQTLIEARSQGLPIVMYDTFPAARWVVEDGRSGYLVRQGDKADFRRKVRMLAHDGGLYFQMSVRALELAADTQESKVAEQWLCLLREATSRSASYLDRTIY